MPAAIATRPETYEAWEFTHPDRHDLAAMGRVWYLEAWARAEMGDARSAGGTPQGQRGWTGQWLLLAGALSSGRQRRQPAGRCRAVLRVPRQPDPHRSTIPPGCRPASGWWPGLSTVVTEDFWQRGFGQTIAWGGRKLTYRMQRGHSRERIGEPRPCVSASGCHLTKRRHRCVPQFRGGWLRSGKKLG